MVDTILRSQGQMAGQAYAMVMYKRREQYSRFGIPAEKHLYVDLAACFLSCYFVIPVVIGAVWWLVFILVLAVVGTATTAVYKYFYYCSSFGR